MRAKRFTSLSLLLSVLISEVAQSQPGSIPEKEVYAYSWSTPNSGNGAHIYPVLRFTPTSDPATLAVQSLATVSGRTALFLWDGQRTVLGNSLDGCIDPQTNELTAYRCPYLENGTQITQTKFQDFFNAFSQAGGRINYLVLDSEIGLSNWHLGNTPAPYDAIESDQRFTTHTLPELLEMAANAGRPSLTFEPLSKIGTNYSNRDEIGAWNALMYERVGDALVKAVYDPVRSLYPAVQMSDYGYFDHNSDYPIYDPNGWPLAQFGTGKVVGTHGAPSLYGKILQLHYPSRSPTGEEFPATAFNAFRYDVNTMRSVMLGTKITQGSDLKNVKVSPWIPYRSFTNAPYRNSDFYQEMIYHTVLAGADHLLLWNPPQADKGALDDHFVSETLSELNNLVGFEDRYTLISQLSDWRGDHILTTMYANGLKVSRLTPQSDLAASCSTSSKRLLTCSIGNSTIKFPKGIVHVADNSMSSAGIWIMQPDTAASPYY